MQKYSSSRFPRISPGNRDTWQWWSFRCLGFVSIFKLVKFGKRKRNLHTHTAERFAHCVFRDAILHTWVATRGYYIFAFLLQLCSFCPLTSTGHFRPFAFLFPNQCRVCWLCKRENGQIGRRKHICQKRGKVPPPCSIGKTSRTERILTTYEPLWLCVW